MNSICEKQILFLNERYYLDDVLFEAFTTTTLYSPSTHVILLHGVKKKWMIGVNFIRVCISVESKSNFYIAKKKPKYKSQLLLFDKNIPSIRVVSYTPHKGMMIIIIIQSLLLQVTYQYYCSI